MKLERRLFNLVRADMLKNDTVVSPSQKLWAFVYTFSKFVGVVYTWRGTDAALDVTTQNVGLTMTSVSCSGCVTRRS